MISDFSEAGPSVQMIRVLRIGVRIPAVAANARRFPCGRIAQSPRERLSRRGCIPARSTRWRPSPRNISATGAPSRSSFSISGARILTAPTGHFSIGNRGAHRRRHGRGEERRDRFARAVLLAGNQGPQRRRHHFRPDFEHTEFFWLTMREMKHALKPGGLCCIIAPSAGPEHQYPVDCWRVYPDGLRAAAR